MHNNLPESIRKFLQENNFANSEIDIIAALLERNGQSLRELSRNLGKSTGVVGASLKKLISKKIIKKEEINGSKSYLIADKNDLVRIIEAETNKKISLLENKNDGFKEYISTLFTQSNIPKIRYFNTLEGVESAYNEAIKNCKSEICAYLSASIKQTDQINHLVQNFMKKRVKANISARMIATKSIYSLALKIRDKLQMRETRIIGVPTHATYNSELMIYDKYLFITSCDGNNLLSVIIEDESTATMQKTMFELAWNAAYADNKKIEEKMAQCKSAEEMLRI